MVAMAESSEAGKSLEEPHLLGVFLDTPRPESNQVAFRRYCGVACPGAEWR